MVRISTNAFGSMPSIELTRLLQAGMKEEMRQNPGGTECTDLMLELRVYSVDIYLCTSP